MIIPTRTSPGKSRKEGNDSGRTLNNSEEMLMEMYHKGRIESLVDDAKGKATVLNEEYASIFTVEGTNTIPNPDLPMLHITESRVQTFLQGLNTHKAMGPDELLPRVLQELAEEITPVLTKVFQKSIHYGSFPEKWRSANITPIFNKGKSSSASNYKPVILN